MVVQRFMERSVVLYEKRDRVAYVTLNRPHVLNALNDRMHVEFAEIWDDIESDEEVLVSVITGAGNRAFSVGQDLKELAQRHHTCATGTPSTFGSVGKPGYPRLTERFKMSKPLIARVHGLALGGGFELALACDIVVASNLPNLRCQRPSSASYPARAASSDYCDRFPVELLWDTYSREGA